MTVQLYDSVGNSEQGASVVDTHETMSAEVGILATAWTSKATKPATAPCQETRTSNTSRKPPVKAINRHHNVELESTGAGAAQHGSHSWTCDERVNSPLDCSSIQVRQERAISTDNAKVVPALSKPRRWIQRSVLTFNNPKHRIQEALRHRRAVFNIQSQLRRRQSMFSEPIQQERGPNAAMSLQQQQQQQHSVSLREIGLGDVGLALFDPLDLEYLRGEISEDESTIRSLSPTPQLGEPMVVPPLATTSCCTASLASLTVATDQESLQLSDEEEEEEQYPADIQSEPEEDLKDCPRILTESMIQQLHEEGLPSGLRMHRWERCFAIGKDGDSFLTFRERCAPYQQTLIVIKTTNGHILGGFASECWAVRGGFTKGHSYFGTGQSFVFATHPAIHAGLDVEKDPSKELMLYRWSGDNDYCQICNVDEKKLAMGGVGDFGLIVQDDFYTGQTGRCRTFDNPPLTPDFAGQFEIESFEVYGLAPLFQAMSPPASTRSVASFSAAMSLIE